MFNNNTMENMPSFIERELETITELVKPRIKKSSKYMMIAIPLLGISIVNLFLLFVTTGWSLDTMIAPGIYALVGAIGAALFRESKLTNKEIRKIGMKHIIERINKSEHVDDDAKKKYIKNIKSQPKFGLQTFINFLTEEHQSLMDS
ncbi:DUF5392 family protein [Virgibacillus kekensis]|uniref:DUF5392 family protein n=1 Tax=Virgibacillus kekensis TaxID=202261 RepID=A0ABV9DJL5_9BACI